MYGVLGGSLGAVLVWVLLDVGEWVGVLLGLLFVGVEVW